MQLQKNAITGELHRPIRIASDFDEETKRIRSKYTDAGYPKHNTLTDRKMSI